MLRRMLAFVLLIAFGLPLAAQLTAGPSDTEQNLPACCRRHGKHHCAMAMAGSGSSSTPAFQAPPCPSYPVPAMPATGFAVALLPDLKVNFAVGTQSPFVTASVRLAPRLVESAYLTRGPPLQQS